MNPLYWLPIIPCLFTLISFTAHPSLCVYFAASAIICNLILYIWLKLSSLRLLSLVPALTLILLLHRDPSFPAYLTAFAFCCYGRLLFSQLEKHFRLRNLSFADDLEKIFPEKACIYIDNDILSEADTKALQPGMIVRLNSGETNPADGIVTSGSAIMDEEPLLGNKEPRAVSLGARVFAGTINNRGSILVKVTNSGANTAAAKLSASLRRNHYDEKVTIAFELALALLVVLGIVTAQTNKEILNYFLGSVSIGFASAMSIFYSIWTTHSAALGRIWKSHRAALAVAKTDTILSDFESITTGKYTVASIFTRRISEDAVIRYAGALARKIEDGKSYAILTEMRIRNLPVEPLENFVENKNGASGTLEGDQIQCLGS